MRAKHRTTVGCTGKECLELLIEPDILQAVAVMTVWDTSSMRVTPKKTTLLTEIVVHREVFFHRIPPFQNLNVQFACEHSYSSGLSRPSGT